VLCYRLCESLINRRPFLSKYLFVRYSVLIHLYNVLLCRSLGCLGLFGYDCLTCCL